MAHVTHLETELVFTLPQEDLANNVIITDMHTARVKYRELLTQAARKTSSIDPHIDKGLPYLNLDSVADNGIFVYVPPHTSLNEPITYELLATRDHSLVILGTESRLSFVERTRSDVDHTGSLTIIAERDATITLFECNQAGSQTNHSRTIHTTLFTRACFHHNYFFLGAQEISRTVRVTLAEPEARLKSRGVVLASNAQQVNITYQATHAAPYTDSDIWIKSVLRRQARISARGNVCIEKDGVGSHSQLKDHMLVLNSGATAEPYPAFEISASEVDARHSSSVTNLNPEMVFYAMSRGFSESEAHKMIALGFLQEVLDEFRAPEAITEALEETWQNSLT